MQAADHRIIAQGERHMTETHFASAERTDPRELEREIEIVSNNPVMDTLLETVSGLIAVLDENRQVVAVNDALMAAFGIHDPHDAFGLRPGEALACTYSHDEPGGCGTTRHCSSCGAAIAVVTSLDTDETVERMCALRTTRDCAESDVCLLVRSHPVRIDGVRFLLLFLQDITDDWRRAALERTFFHDINNMLGSLAMASSLLADGETDPELVQIIRRSAARLAREVAIQKCLRDEEDCAWQLDPEPTTLGELLGELDVLFGKHPAAEGKRLEIDAPAEDAVVHVDVSLLLRVLGNMVTNALEASAPGATVRVWADVADGQVTFGTWNDGLIPDAVALRVFQRNFSTKKGPGRGIGTYSMKMIGERYLGGEVRFSTSAEDGTTFELIIPRDGDAARVDVSLAEE